MIKTKLALFTNLVFFSGAALAGPFQDGQAYGNAAVAPGGTLSNVFGNGNSAVSSLNSGTNLVQPNGSSVINLQNDGIAGNSNGTGLGSFGNNKVNQCAFYVPGSGGPAKDAECGAVNFSSQQSNINARANTAYGLTPGSSLFANANNAIANAQTPAGMQSLLPAGISNSVSGTSTCTSTPGTTQYATQSCFIYAGQSTSGGAVTTYMSGSSVNVTCTNPANITSQNCTVSPAQPTYSATCTQAVPVAKTCNQVASANVTASTANYCNSGSSTIWEFGGCWANELNNHGVTCWGGYGEYPGVKIPLGTATVTCSGNNSASVNISIAGAYNRGSWTSPVLVEGSPSSGSFSFGGFGSFSYNWDGVSNLTTSSGVWWSAGFLVQVPMGKQSGFTVTPTYQDGCAQYETSQQVCSSQQSTAACSSVAGKYGIPGVNTVGTANLSTTVCTLNGATVSTTTNYSTGCLPPTGGGGTTQTCSTANQSQSCQSVAGQYTIPSNATSGTASLAVTTCSNGTSNTVYNGGCSVPVTCTEIAETPVACSSFAGQYGIPSNATSGQASWTENSCTGAVTYTGGCSVPQPTSCYTTTAQLQIAELYSAVAHRLPDAAGFTYWVGQYQGGMGATAIAQVFISSAEFQSELSSQTYQAFLNVLYQNVYGSPNVDPNGYAYWLNLLANGTVTPAYVLLQFATSSQNAADTIAYTSSGSVCP